MKMCFSHQSATTFRSSICNLLPAANPSNRGLCQGRRDFKRKEPFFAGKVLPTHLFPNNKHYSFSVSEKAIGGLYWNTKAAMADG